MTAPVQFARDGGPPTAGLEATGPSAARGRVDSGSAGAEGPREGSAGMKRVGGALRGGRNSSVLN